MYIREIKVSDLSKKDVRRLRALTLGSNGLMQFYLESGASADTARLRTRKDEVACIAYENNTMIGWVMLMKRRTCSICVWKSSVHIFVRERYRNQGIARFLLKHVIDKTAATRLYCQGNIKFFKLFGIKHA